MPRKNEPLTPEQWDRALAAARGMDPAGRGFFRELGAAVGVPAASVRRAWSEGADGRPPLRRALLEPAPPSPPDVPPAPSQPGQSRAFDAAVVRAHEDEMVHESRETTLSLARQTHDLVRSLEASMPEIARRVQRMVEEKASGDLDDAGLDALISVLSRLTKTHKDITEASQRTVQTGRLVQGEADAVVGFQFGGPSTPEELHERLLEAAGAMKRHAERRAGKPN